MSISIWNIFSMITLQLKFQFDLWSNILGRICGLDSCRCRFGLAGQASMSFDTCISFEMWIQNLKSQLVSWMPCSVQFYAGVDFKVEFYCPSAPALDFRCRLRSPGPVSMRIGIRIWISMPAHSRDKEHLFSIPLPYVNERSRGVPRSEGQPLCQQY